MPVTSHKVDGAGPCDEKQISPGCFQVIVCAACGYTEWYAYDLERLKEIPEARLVGDDQGDAGPYR